MQQPTEVSTAAATAKPAVVEEPPSVLACSLCCKKFVNALNLRRHESRCENKHGIRFRCHTCNKGFKAKFRFDTHSCTNCRFCSKFLHSRAALNQHIDAVHRDGRSAKLYACDICGGRFTFKATLTRHIMTMHFASDEPHYCHLCPKMFKNPLSLKIHVRKHKNLVSCDVCDAKVNPRSLVTHKRDAHGIAKTFLCNACPASFSARSRLRGHHERHMKSADEAHNCEELECGRFLNEMTYSNRYVCRICHVRHDSYLSMRLHMMASHDEPRLRPLKCDQCAYTTFIRGHMQDHLLAHKNNWFII